MHLLSSANRAMIPRTAWTSSVSIVRCSRIASTTRSGGEPTSASERTWRGYRSHRTASAHRAAAESAPGRPTGAAVSPFPLGPKLPPGRMGLTQGEQNDAVDMSNVASQCVTAAIRTRTAHAEWVHIDVTWRSQDLGNGGRGTRDVGFDEGERVREVITPAPVHGAGSAGGSAGPAAAGLPCRRPRRASSMSPLTTVFDPVSSPHMNIATRSSPTQCAASAWNRALDRATFAAEAGARRWRSVCTRGAVRRLPAAPPNPERRSSAREGSPAEMGGGELLQRLCAPCPRPDGHGAWNWSTRWRSRPRCRHAI